MKTHLADATETARFRLWAKAYIARHHEPDFTVLQDGDPYLQRWYVLPRNPVANVYLHRFLRSDEDRALHDHPWRSTSWVLEGGYREHLSDGLTAERPVGSVTERVATDAHRVELRVADPTTGLLAPATTLFFTGAVEREWGFLCPNGWVPWREFVKVVPGGNERGPGCGE